MALAVADEVAEDLVEVALVAEDEEAEASAGEEVDSVADEAAVASVAVVSAAGVALAEGVEDLANAVEVADSVDDPVKDLEGAVGLAVAAKVVSAVEADSAEEVKEVLVEAAG